jgi:hypothetical protein
MILFRTQNLDDTNRKFAEQLAACNDGRIAIVVDETRHTIDTTPWPKISLTRPNLRRLSLVCPYNVGWRCGDYGFYFAREQFPDERAFWMIEHDVRFSGAGPAAFFDRFRNDQTSDLLAPMLRNADRKWYWEYTVIASGMTAHRCLFPIIRLSAKAIDYALAKRRQLGRRMLRRAVWANDESFVATALMNNPAMVCHDLNDGGAPLYSGETLSFEKPFEGDVMDLGGADEALTIYHPVLFGSAYQAKLERMRNQYPDRRLYRRILRRLVRAINQHTAW